MLNQLVWSDGVIILTDFYSFIKISHLSSGLQIQHMGGLADTLISDSQIHFGLKVISTTVCTDGISCSLFRILLFSLFLNVHISLFEPTVTYKEMKAYEKNGRTNL